MYPFFWTVSEKRGTYQAKKGTNAGMKALRGLSVSFVSFVYRAKLCVGVREKITNIHLSERGNKRRNEDNKNAA
ncbi:hypothetical protein CJI55_01175 [Gardnerella vaginalis]|nr:hypothetical protein CJI55_01175 [Gardnerella vaginalis]